MIDEPEAQMSEVHETTDDASTSPASDAGQKVPPPPQRDPNPDRPPRKHNPQDAFPPDVKVERDDSDVGGPIKIKTRTD